MKRVVIFYDGSPLLLSEIKRDENGLVRSGYVENGHWKLRVISNRFQAYDGEQLKNEWQVLTVLEVKIPDSIKGDYNLVIEYARDELKSGNYSEWNFHQ